MSYLTQAFPPAPTFTETSLEDLSKKVYIITGATSGVGLELAKILYGANGTVYICGRSKESTSAAISDIKGALPQSKGRLRALIFDLSSLASIRPAVDCFLAKEQRLDVLFLNAGVMTPPAGSRTTDGYDLELGSHCLAPFLLCRLLQPTLEATAKWQQLGLDTLNRSEGTDESFIPSAAGNNIAPKSSSVRIVWVSSFINAAPNGGVQFDENTGAPKQMTGTENYLQSKAGEILLAEEYNRKYSDKGVVNVGVNPGLLKTNLQRHMPAVQRAVMHRIFKPANFGAYSELYAGLSPDVRAGDFVIPFGRKSTIPCHMQKSLESKQEKGSVASRFWDWCEDQVKSFL